MLFFFNILKSSILFNILFLNYKIKKSNTEAFYLIILITNQKISKIEKIKKRAIFR